eukprot:GHVQ01010600.1.p1 GENE.GHVQ01010600.1~~GHVQ01010600.1.p1  ORF type:complete len:157 (+),score=11.31 GHVQ01010600.1:166-636(+)
MRLVLQRVRSASVSVKGEVVGKIGPGIVCLIGIAVEDTWDDAEYIVRKSLKGRLWSAENEDINWRRSVMDCKLEVLLVSQFTLFGSFKKGNKPEFRGAMAPKDAEPMFNKIVEHYKTQYDASKIQTGKFGHYMRKGRSTVVVGAHGSVSGRLGRPQ